MTEALPCIVCGTILPNVDDTATNQPSEGTAFESEGHYGSTAFDPMDGSYIEITVCDQCLTAARESGRVLWSRTRKLVVCDGMVVGWCKTPNRPLLPWTGTENDGGPADEALFVEREELGADWLPEVTWHQPAVEALRRSPI